MLSWLIGLGAEAVGPAAAPSSPTGSEKATGSGHAADSRAAAMHDGGETSGAFASAGQTFQVLSGTVVPGYDAFVAAQSKTLHAYAKLRSEMRALNFLAQHPVLLEEIAHVRHFFLMRHLDLKMPMEEAEEEAAGFFLLDAAAHAARSHYLKHKESVSASAQEGVRMLAAAVSAPGDPVGVGPCIAQRVGAWMGVVHQQRDQLREHLFSKGSALPHYKSPAKERESKHPASSSPKPARSPKHKDQASPKQQHAEQQPPNPQTKRSPATARGKTSTTARNAKPPLKERRSKPAVDPARVLETLGYKPLGPIAQLHASAHHGATPPPPRYKPLGPIAAGAFSTILRCKALRDSGAVRGGVEVAVKSFDAAKCAHHLPRECHHPESATAIRRTDEMMTRVPPP